ncbi:ferrochelatase [Paucimonas lemoignei]|uniref:Ferrochelatase n=1 Tax=Paucimonas lemoignei TaxID=29443 RepID=A0A4R3HUS0_PAULE|nr:ferrochelatase [Paucimonas lemoignei]TCS36808.1 ferrochelatase [Paucimonas lemoignei]
MAFRKEPSYTHGSAQQTAVLLVNLGTPDEPTPAAVRRYLKEFLSDPRVVEIPKAVWAPILHGVILPFRSSKSAAKYASIWESDGSPLKLHTERQATLLRGYIGERGHQVHVAYAMRYGSPSIPQVLQQLQEQRCTRILVLPAYPQYAGSTTASVYDAVFQHYAGQRNVPELRMVKHYHDHEAYIDALRHSVLAHWDMHGRPEKLVMSFHGVPKRTLDLGDPYHCECHKTARLLATQLGLAEDRYLVTFQSRFGKAEWLQPYTAPSVRKLAEQGVKRIDVMCPGFVADCLETLEEVDMEVRQEFLMAGGREFHYIPCLNENPAWIHALTDIAEEHLLGWPTMSNGAAREVRERDLAISRKRAQELGAKQ